MEQLKSLIFLIFILISHSHGFKVGKVYEYKYCSSVNVNDQQNKLENAVGLKVCAKQVKITKQMQHKSHSIYLLDIDSFETFNFKNTKSFVEKVGDYVIVDMVNNEFNGIYVNSKIKDEIAVKNSIRALASTLLMPLVPEDNVQLQTDVSGKCSVAVRSQGKNKIVKTKNACQNFITSHYLHVKKVLGDQISSSSVLEYQMDNNEIIEAVKGTESHQISVQVDQSITTVASLQLEISRLGVTKSAIKNQAGDADQVVQQYAKEYSMQFSKISINAELSLPKNNPPTLESSIKSVKKNLKTEHLGHLKSASAFLKLLAAFRTAKNSQLVSIVKSNKAVANQLMDVLGSSQTADAIDAAIELLSWTVGDDQSEQIELIERFLLSSAISGHPNAYGLQKLLDVAKSNKVVSPKVQQSLLLTIGSLMHSISLQHHHSQLLEDCVKYMTNQLASCKKHDDISSQTSCQQIYLRALINARMPPSVPALLKVIQNGGKLAVLALKALHNIPSSAITNQVKQIVANVYFGSMKQDSSAKIVAADILLHNQPSQELVDQILASLSAQKGHQEETSTYMLKRLFELSEQLPEVKQKLALTLHRKQVANYNTVAQKGMSVAMTNSLFGDEEFNATYGMHTELLKGGMLKSTSFDVNMFSAGGGHTPLISVGAFAAGLEAFAGTGDETETDEPTEDATCGMQISILGVTLRPYVFFTGQSELMSLVWSGAGSDPTPALQANLLLHDSKQYIVLLNGMIVQQSLQSVVSTDLSGSVQISLWNRNAESVVNNRGALVMDSKLVIDWSSAQASISRVAKAQASLDFVTSLDFYNSPSRMCMEMNQPEFDIVRLVTKVESMKTIAGVNYERKRKSSKKVKVDGRSYGLPNAIYKACASLKSE